MMYRDRKHEPLLAMLLLIAVPGLALGQQGTESDPPDAATDVEFTQQARKNRSGGFWQRLRLGATISLLSGTDKIRTDSANTVTFRDISINSGAILFEPRVEASGRISLSPVRTGQGLDFLVDAVFIRDPRKDTGAFQDNAIEETLWLDLNAAYDVKSWKHGTLFLQLDAGIYEGDVGDLEVAIDIAEQAILNPDEQDLVADDPFANFQFLYPTIGKLTQMPISLSGLWQFRPRSPFRPYVGLGFGYIETELEESSQLASVNAQLAGIDFIWNVRNQTIASGILPAKTISAEAVSDTTWLAQGGLEYNVNRNWSVYFAAKFMSTAARVRVRSLNTFERFGIGIARSDAVDDVEGIGSEDVLIRRLLGLSVEDAVQLIADIDDTSPAPLREQERRFFTSFPVQLGPIIQIQVPNPVLPGMPINQPRQTKLFVQGGDIQLDSFSVGVGFRYRY